MSTNTSQLMSDAKFYESYARYNSELSRYETWDEAVDRLPERPQQDLATRRLPSKATPIRKSSDLKHKFVLKPTTTYTT